MTTVDPDTLERDRNVLRDIMQRFDGRIALKAQYSRSWPTRQRTTLRGVPPPLVGQPETRFGCSPTCYLKISSNQFHVERSTKRSVVITVCDGRALQSLDSRTFRLVTRLRHPQRACQISTPVTQVR